MILDLLNVAFSFVVHSYWCKILTTLQVEGSGFTCPWPTASIPSCCISGLVFLVLPLLKTLFPDYLLSPNLCSKDLCSPLKNHTHCYLSVAFSVCHGNCCFSRLLQISLLAVIAYCFVQWLFVFLTFLLPGCVNCSRAGASSSITVWPMYLAQCSSSSREFWGFFKKTFS